MALLPAQAGSMDTPTIEPTEITAGDTVRWQRSLPDYPASDGWVLSYALVNTSNKIALTGTASGDDHLIAASATTSATWAAGQYDWQAVVTRSAERFTVGYGRITIKPNLAAAASGYDNRTQARKILEALRAAYETYVGSRGHVSEYEIAGRKMKFRSVPEILQQIEHWQREVAREEQAASLAAGRRPGRVLVRFDR